MPRKLKFKDRALDTGDILDASDPITTVFPRKRGNTEWVDFLANVLQGQESLVRANRSYNVPATVNIMNALLPKKGFKLSKYQCVVIFNKTNDETDDPYVVQPFDEHYIHTANSGVDAGGFNRNTNLIEDIIEWWQHSDSTSEMGFFISVSEWIPGWNADPSQDDPVQPMHVNSVFLHKTGENTMTVQHFEPHMSSEMYLNGVQANLEAMFTIVEDIAGVVVTLESTLVEGFGATAQVDDQFCQTWSFWYLYLRANGNDHIAAIRLIHEEELGGLLGFMRMLLLCVPLPKISPKKALWEYSASLGGMLSTPATNQFVLPTKHWGRPRKPRKWPSNIN